MNQGITWQYSEFRLPTDAYQNASIAPQLRSGWELIGIHIRTEPKRRGKWAVMRRRVQPEAELQSAAA